MTTIKDWCIDIFQHAPVTELQFVKYVMKSLRKNSDLVKGYIASKETAVEGGVSER